MNEDDLIPTPAPIQCGICHSRDIKYFVVPAGVLDKCDVIFISCRDCNGGIHMRRNW